MATHHLVRLLALSLLLLGASASAGEYNEVLSIGDPAPAWVELPGVDDRKHSLKDLAEKDVVVVVFTCNSCPVATDYEDRLIELAKRTWSGGTVAFVAINVNKVKEDSLANMKVRAEAKGFPFPYLFDETQKIAKAFGANFTPEFFVLNKDRKVVYMGSLDDHSDAKLAKQPYLATAIQGTLSGQAAKPAETLAIGCRIRFVRERK
jgi:peroxiredoxin